MRSTTIRPEYALLFTYDVRPETKEPYFRYLIGEFTPSLQEYSIYMQDAWHVTWGNYPERQIEYITEHLDGIRQLVASQEWQKMEERLKSYTTHFSWRVVRYTGRFKV